MHIPVIQVINSFLDNDYISFLIYHKDKKKVKVSLLGSCTLLQVVKTVLQTVLLWYCMGSRVRCLESNFDFTTDSMNPD